MKDIAILIDGAFFLRRIRHILNEKDWQNCEEIIAVLDLICATHVQKLVGNTPNWIDHIYRIFFYDAVPFSGASQHPLTGKTIDFAKTEIFNFKTDLFQNLRQHRKLALRLGEVHFDKRWEIPHHFSRQHADALQSLLALESERLETRESYTTILGKSLPTPRPRKKKRKPKDPYKARRTHLKKIIKARRSLLKNEESLFSPRFRQKGVDMRIGIDITSITLKKQAKTIVLISGDADFVPAAKLARREGVEFVLDPMGHGINDDLFEHIDGLQTIVTKEARGIVDKQFTLSLKGGYTRDDPAPLKKRR